MGIRSATNIKIIKRATTVTLGTAPTKPKTSTLEDIFRVDAQLESKTDDFNRNLTVYDSTYIPGIVQTQADELHQELVDYRNGKDMRSANLGNFFDLFYNKKNSRMDNDFQLNKSPNRALLPEALQRGLVVGKKGRTRTSYSLTEDGRRLANLYCTRFYLPYDETLLQTKYIHPVPEYQRRFFGLRRRNRMFFGVGNTHQLSEDNIDLGQHFEFADFTPPPSRVKPGRFDVQPPDLPLYTKMTKMLLDSFAVLQLNEAKPVLMDTSGWKNGRQLTFSVRDELGMDQLLTAEESQFAYFHKNYGTDVKIYVDPKKLIYKNSTAYREGNTFPVAVIKDGRLVGAFSVNMLSSVNSIIDTRDVWKVSQPRRSPGYPAFINFWRAFGKM